MDATVTTEGRQVWFESPARFLADLDPATTGRVIASAADVALIVEQGVIRDVAFGNDDLSREGYGHSWRGREWIDTVTIESRPKIEYLLQVEPSSVAHWRQVNHPSAGGLDVPIRYTAVRTGHDDRVVALGRDLRSLARLQQRLVEAHQSLERDYARLREAESRYTLLFQSVSEPVLILAAATSTVAEMNPAAVALLAPPDSEEPDDSAIGRAFGDLFAPHARAAAEQAVAASLSLGHADAVALELRSGAACRVWASVYRGGEDARVIVRFELAESGTAPSRRPESPLLPMLEQLPDGLVVTGSDLRIRAANPAFIEMTQAASEQQLADREISEYLGRSLRDLNVLVSTLRNHGMVRNFATVMRDRFGNEEDVEVSAVATPHGDDASYGFSVRSVARRLRSEAEAGKGLPSSADQLTGLVGRMPLRDIVRQSTNVIERLCIEAALEITDDNRASAAEMLGLSRQGLYSKLRRFGLDDSR